MKRLVSGAARLCLGVYLLAGLSVAAAEPARAGTNSPVAPAASNIVANSAKKQTAGPFHGRLLAMDKTARTLTMGKRTFSVTPETRISKGGKPATFEDGVVGEMVSGYFRTAADGKLLALKVTFGPKVETGKAEPAAPRTTKKRP